MKIVSWIKSNWFSIILLIAVIFLTWRLYFFSDTYEVLFNENVKQSELFHKQLKDLENINKKLKQDQEKLQSDYKKDIENIKTDYIQKIDELAKMKKASQTKIVKEAKENPQTLTNKIEEVFGIPAE